MDDVWGRMPQYLDLQSLLRMSCVNTYSATVVQPTIDAKNNVLMRLGAGWMRPIIRENIRGYRCGIPREWWSDYDVVLLAVTQDGRSLQYATPELRREYNIAIAAVTQDPEAWWYVDEDIRYDHEIFYHSRQW